MFRVVNLIGLISVISIQLSGALCDNEGVAINPCAYTDCFPNSTCLAIPDPQNPQPCYLGNCEMIAICVPNGPQNYHGQASIYCGTGGEKCSIDEKCEFVEIACIALAGTTCPPVALVCVPKNPQPIIYLTPLTKSGLANSTKYSKFVVQNNDVLHQQRRQGLPHKGKHSNVVINTGS